MKDICWSQSKESQVAAFYNFHPPSQVDEYFFEEVANTLDK